MNHRIIDANLNRAAEALRVLEEIARFELDDEELSKELKELRHNVCIALEAHYDNFLTNRDTENDVGTEIKNTTKELFKEFDLKHVFKSNIKRLQQALRVLFEYSGNEIFEKARYRSYTLEKTLWERLNMDLNKIRLQNRKLYLVTNSDGFASDGEFLDAVGAALAGGVDIVQLREKNSGAKRIIELGKRIRELCSMFGALFIVNDRVDIASIVEADGVHLGQDDLDLKYAREILGKTAIIGISTHEPAHAKAAIANGADYIGVGPVFTTPTKPGRPAAGLDYLKWAGENVEIPFFAIGGIDETNISQVISNGAKKIAVVRAIINSKDPKSSAQNFLNKLNSADKI